jgi:malate dehydrogenase
MGKSRIGVVGAGHVGATTARRLAELDIGDVLLSDIVEGMPQGKMLDMAESSPIEGFDSQLTGVNDNSELTDCDLVVITAGVPRKPGMSRKDLLEKNANIMTDVVEDVTEASPEATLLVVSNPLDIMVQLALKRSDFPENRVLGMAGVLDSIRFSYFISDELDVSVKDVRAMVLGGHGDEMVPLPEYSSVNGIPVTELIDQGRLEDLIERTRNAGGEIVDLLGDGSAFYAPSSAITAMAKSILLDQNRIMPACAYLQGEYGLEDICMGVPVKLGQEGVSEIVELDLPEQKREALHESAETVRGGVEQLGI